MTAKIGYGWARFWFNRSPRGGAFWWVECRRARLRGLKSLRTGRRVWDV